MRDLLLARLEGAERLGGVEIEHERMRVDRLASQWQATFWAGLVLAAAIIVGLAFAGAVFWRKGPMLNSAEAFVLWTSATSLFALLLTLCFQLNLMSRHVRWRDVFYVINPGLKYVSQPLGRSWFKWRVRISDPLQRQLSARLIEKLTVSSEPINKTIIVHWSLPLAGASITRDDLVMMARELELLAAKKAHGECSHFKLISVEVLSSMLAGNVWEVEAHWSVHCDQAAVAPDLGKHSNVS